MSHFLDRTEMLIGKEKIQKLQHATVAVFGIGGVGSYAAEALVRSGIGNLVIIDHDKVDVTNINRQLIADTTTIGLPKVLVAGQEAGTLTEEGALLLDPTGKLEPGAKLCPPEGDAGT